MLTLEPVVGEGSHKKRGGLNAANGRENAGKWQRRLSLASVGAGRKEKNCEVKGKQASEQAGIALYGAAMERAIV